MADLSKRLCPSVPGPAMNSVEVGSTTVRLQTLSKDCAGVVLSFFSLPELCCMSPTSSWFDQSCKHTLSLLTVVSGWQWFATVDALRHTAKYCPSVQLVQPKFRTALSQVSVEQHPEVITAVLENCTQLRDIGGRIMDHPLRRMSADSKLANLEVLHCQIDDADEFLATVADKCSPPSDSSTLNDTNTTSSAPPKADDDPSGRRTRTTHSALRDLSLQRGGFSPDTLLPSARLSTLLRKVGASLTSLQIRDFNMHKHGSLEDFSLLTALKNLTMYETELDNDDTQVISRALPKLEALRLEYNIGISERGILHLSEHMIDLKEISIAYTGVDAKPFFQALGESPLMFPRLEKVTLYYKDVRADFHSHRPHMKIFGYNAM